MDSQSVKIDTNFKPRSSPAARRYSFDLTNILLGQRMSIDRMEIDPIPDQQKKLRRAHSFETRELVTAQGCYLFAPDQEVDDALLKVDHVSRLLSFASRSTVRCVNGKMEEFDGRTWRETGTGHLIPPFYGTVKPRPMVGIDGGLQGFLSRNLPTLIQDDTDHSTGVLAAIRFFTATLEPDYTESRYLKSWIALEIMYSLHAGEAQILDKSSFRKVGKAIRRNMESLVESGDLDATKNSLMTEKIQELNRLSAKQQAMPFFESILCKHPRLIPTSYEFKRLSSVRNEITHTGRMNMPNGGDNYNLELIRIRLQLTGLVEVCILGVLGESNLLDDRDWRRVRSADATVH